MEAPIEAPIEARLAAVADGTGGTMTAIARQRHDYRQVALIAKLWRAAPHEGIAFERFTPDGPMALLPENDRYGLVWTATPDRAQELLALDDSDFLDRLARHFGPRTGGSPASPIAARFRSCSNSPASPRARAASRSAMPRRRCIRSPGRDSTSGCATLGSSRRSCSIRRASEIGDEAMLRRYSRGRRADRMAGIAFTHGLVRLFGNDLPLVRWPRGLALTLLDSVPAAKRAFTRAMLFGIR